MEKTIIEDILKKQSRNSSVRVVCLNILDGCLQTNTISKEQEESELKQLEERRLKYRCMAHYLINAVEEKNEENSDINENNDPSNDQGSSV